MLRLRLQDKVEISMLLYNKVLIGSNITGHLSALTNICRKNVSREMSDANISM